jgi:thioester reductase-like protein
MFCFGVVVLRFWTSPWLSDSSKLFNPLQEFASVPKDRLRKVTYVEGDMAKLGLGLSNEHCGLLMSSHISLVSHIAASVSFKDTILGAMQTNAWPANEVVRLCQAMTDVKVKKSGSVCVPSNLWKCTYF